VAEVGATGDPAPRVALRVTRRGRPCCQVRGTGLGPTTAAVTTRWFLVLPVGRGRP